MKTIAYKTLSHCVYIYIKSICMVKHLYELQLNITLLVK